MAVTLVVNPGSSSRKYALFRDASCLMQGLYEANEEQYAVCVSRGAARMQCYEISTHHYEHALKDFIERAQHDGVISEIDEITVVGVRAVVPSSRFLEHQLLNTSLLEELSAHVGQAPLHVPPLLHELAVVREIGLTAPLWLISDSAFHATIPIWRQTYSVKEAADFDIRRFGYHGLSVASIARRLATTLQTKSENVVVVHLGSGVSVTALSGGKSIATTMGYTPGSGLMMSSRAGDLDPGALIRLMQELDLAGSAAHVFVQRAGGFKGLVGTADLRTVLTQVAHKDSKAREALQLFIEKLQQAILTMAIPLRRIDALVLTGTALERNPDLRDMVVSDIPLLDVALDEDRNTTVLGSPQIISSAHSKVTVAVVPTDEMGEIARVSLELAG